MSEVFDFRRSRAGDEYECEMSSDGVVTSLRYRRSPEVVYEARLVADREYEARQVEVALEIERHTLAGTIENSFFGAVTSAGEQEGLARETVAIFQWDIDFGRDVRSGDGFRILFEKVFLEGEFLRYGRVLAAEYNGAMAQHGAFYFDDPDFEGCYTADGVPLERFFLAAPCRHRRISSRFDLERWHPVLQRRVPHLGVDYAADTGTPAWASADGEVSHVGYDSRAGNVVKIRHSNRYESIYAHLHGFAAGLREGQTVEQGQVIGYVGSTGMSTGPHLHYGLKRRGDYVDPLAEEFERGDTLTGRALRDFQRRHSQLVTRMAEVPLPSSQGVPDVASNSSLLPRVRDLLTDADAHDY
jgi:murein DD-endopeptidase MepM/ murein hydrolase activator NlpD